MDAVTTTRVWSVIPSRGAWIYDEELDEWVFRDGPCILVVTRTYQRTAGVRDEVYEFLGKQEERFPLSEDCVSDDSNGDEVCIERLQALGLHRQEQQEPRFSL